MSGLLCIENGGDEKRAISDRHIRESSCVLINLLRLECALPASNYVGVFQRWMTTEHRRHAMYTLIELSEYFNLADNVFPLAVSIIDRFLAKKLIAKEHYCLTTFAALLIATKLRSVRYLPCSVLVELSGHAFTVDELIKWEDLIAFTLAWSLETVTPNEFVDHILYRECTLKSMCSRNLQMVRDHAHVLAQLLLTDVVGITLKPSIIATAAILSALQGLRIHLTTVQQLCRVTRAPLLTVERTARIMEALLDKYSGTGTQIANGLLIHVVS